MVAFDELLIQFKVIPAVMAVKGVAAQVGAAGVPEEITVEAVVPDPSLSATTCQ